MPEIVLPESLQAIADIVGTGAALRIAERWGGTRFYFPADPGEWHELSRLIGYDDARRLCAAYAGERLEIPKADAWSRGMRNQLILDARAAGTPQAALAREHRLTERRIRDIERQGDESDRQTNLF